VIVPREIFGDGKAEVFGIVDDLKLLAVDIIICHDLITLASNAELPDSSPTTTTLEPVLQHYYKTSTGPPYNTDAN
jgi:hypothetical protein